MVELLKVKLAAQTSPFSLRPNIHFSVALVQNLSGERNSHKSLI